MGRDVLAVEPFYDNIIRFHKAVVVENLEQRIRLITNAISDERGQVLSLEKMEENIGGQFIERSINGSNLRTYQKSDRLTNKYLVETILLDDLVDYLPKMPNGQPYTKAMMKIDIEGYEPFALAQAQKMFEILDIRFR